MKKNRFQLTLVPLVASALLSCGGQRSPIAPSTTRVCLDEQGRRVDDAECVEPPIAGTPNANPLVQPIHHWYLVPRGTAAPGFGSFVHGGPFDLHSSGFHHSGSISRGGFGSSAHSSAGS